MSMVTPLATLDPAGLHRFQLLHTEAVNAVTDRFYATFPQAYARFGDRGREATREDLSFHLEFLRPVLEFGMLQPMVDYLRWLQGVLASRSVPTEHLALSLEWLAEFFVQRMDAADGAIVAAALHAARTQFLSADQAAAGPRLRHQPWPEAADFEAAILAGSRDRALQIVTRCMDAGKSLVDVELGIIQPAMYRVGERWQANEVSVAQEHMATAIVQSVMTLALVRATPQAAVGKRVLLACVAGNHHAVGLQMVADAFLLAGWDVHYLGPNVPTASVVSAVADWKPHLVGLSVSFAQQLREVRAVVRALDAAFGTGRPSVIIGGLAVNSFPPLAERLQADASGPDALAAVQTAEAVVASGPVG